MPSRYELLDSDEHRLPEGMQRVGYDADSQTYTYRDNDGSLWEGEEGNRYGRLHRTGTTAAPQSGFNGEGVSAHARNNDWRYMAPWVLIVCLFLLVVWWFVNQAPARVECANGLETYRVLSGDTCWKIAEAHATSVDGLTLANPKLKCNSIMPGDNTCVPSAHDS